MIELVVVVIYWTDCMPRKFGNEIRLPGTTGFDNLPIPRHSNAGQYLIEMYCITNRR